MQQGIQMEPLPMLNVCVRSDGEWSVSWESESKQTKSMWEIGLRRPDNKIQAE